MAVKIVGVGKAVDKGYILQSTYMCPGSFGLYQVVIEYKPAAVVNLSDKIPFLIRIRTPAVMGVVMLDELSCIVCHNFPVMAGFLFLIYIKSILFSSINYGGKS